MSNLLVTGGAGFIGSNFVVHWLSSQPDAKVIVLDALTYAGNLANLQAASRHAHYRFVHGDVCERDRVEQLLRDESIDTIVHFAAESHVDRSISGPDEFIRTNVLGTHSLLEAARRAWLGTRGTLKHRFHHVSTDEVYGSLGPDDPPFVETCRYAPNSPYSASKAAADHLVRAYNVTYGLRTTISNCSNNYGPNQLPEKLIPLAIRNILAGRSVPIYGDGANVRDWLHVADHCVGIEKILLLGRIGETYNLGGQCERRNIDLLHALCEIVDQRFKSAKHLSTVFVDCPPSRDVTSVTLLRHVTDRPGHDRRYAIDFSKASSELGFEPRISLKRGLEDLVDQYLDCVSRRLQPRKKRATPGIGRPI